MRPSKSWLVALLLSVASCIVCQQAVVPIELLKKEIAQVQSRLDESQQILNSLIEGFNVLEQSTAKVAARANVDSQLADMSTEADLSQFQLQPEAQIELLEPVDRPLVSGLAPESRVRDATQPVSGQFPTGNMQSLNSQQQQQPPELGISRSLRRARTVGKDQSRKTIERLRRLRTRTNDHRYVVKARDRFDQQVVPRARSSVFRGRQLFKRMGEKAKTKFQRFRDKRRERRETRQEQREAEEAARRGGGMMNAPVEAINQASEAARSTAGRFAEGAKMAFSNAKTNVKTSIQLPFQDAVPDRLGRLPTRDNQQVRIS